MSETKKCKCCGRELDINEFSVHHVSKKHIAVCKECMSAKQSEGHKKYFENISKAKDSEIENARFLRLADFTPRELMTELRRRGFEGTLTYTEVHTVNLNTMKI